VELNLPAVLERVQALVPTRTAEGARFAIRGPGEPLKGVAVQIPLATTLPGWTLVAWPGAPVKIESLDVGGGFFVVAALLVGAFVVSILAGGAIFFRQAAAAAREATLKTSFVSNVSHEMKTPLTTIRMYAEMLADERVDDPAKRSRYFATIGRETARLTRLVNNALDFGRLEAGRKEYHPETIPLGPWFARLVETYAPRATESGVRLVATPPATGAAVRCDPDSLDQIALNLIDNGLKYGAAGGVLELHADTVAGGWAVVVADRGPGVPAAHRERIFDRFHRVDDALTATKQGAGLGLTIARRLARDQGGDLVCRAREDGGAAFVLTLPVADDGGAPQRETK
jgi:signal transduction histidine kinase